jgi:hypothetical protein
MTQEQQEEIREILKKNRFQGRDRAGRGPALSQGLLRCAVCKGALSVRYHRHKTYSYLCGWRVNPCIQFTNSEFDETILAAVFRVLETPALEMLRAAMDESRSRELTRHKWIESERERLRHEERKAQERADLTRGNLPRVYLDALEKTRKSPSRKGAIRAENLLRVIGAEKP